MGNQASRNTELEKVYQRLKSVYDQQIADEIALRNIQLEQEEAVKLASRRRTCIWEGIAFISAVTAIAGFSFKYKAPLIGSTIVVPMLFAFGYRLDAAYGDQMKDIKERAEKLLEEDRKRFELVGGTITVEEVDKRVAFNERLKRESF